MIREYLATYGVAAGGGISLLIVGRWLLRAQAIAAYLKMSGLIVIVLGVGSVLGVVDLARAAELLSQLAELVGALR